MPQSNVIAQVNAKSQGTSQNHRTDYIYVLSQRKLRKRKKTKWNILFWIIQPELCLLNCSCVSEKNFVHPSGRDYLHCPWCQMDLRLRRSISVRVRPSMSGSMFILTDFYWHTQATYMEEKAESSSISSVWQVPMPHETAVARTKSRLMFVFCFKIIILGKGVWKARFSFLRLQILCITAWISVSVPTRLSSRRWSQTQCGCFYNRVLTSGLWQTTAQERLKNDTRGLKVQVFWGVFPLISWDFIWGDNGIVDSKRAHFTSRLTCSICLVSLLKSPKCASVE